MTSYPFNPGEHLLQTVHLTELEDLTFRRLLDLYFTMEGPLPLDASAVARRTRCDQPTVEKVLAEFFERTHAGWRHERCESIIAAHNTRRSLNSRNGSMGGRIRRAEAKPAEKAPQAGPEDLTLSSDPPKPRPALGQKNLPTNPNALRLAAIFHRKPTTSWTDKEVRAFKALGQLDLADLEAVEAYYAAHWPPDSRNSKNILRHDLITFLNNFRGEVDRARMWQTREKPAAGGKGFWAGSKATFDKTP